MKKQILAAAIAAAVVIPAASAADTNNVVVYGKVDMAITKADREGAGADDWFIHENGGASKLGFKGTEDLGNGLKAIWKMEFDVPVGRTTTGNPLSGGGPVVSNRNAYVGLAGDFGTVLMGRHDTPYKMAFGAWDVFADTIADFNNSNMAQFEDERAQDGIAYVSPSMNGLSFAGAVVTGSASENGAVAGQEEDINEHYSLAVNYNNNGIMAAVAYEVLTEDTLNRLGVGMPANGDMEKLGVALGYKGNGFFVGGRYDDNDRARQQGGNETTSWALMGSYDFGNNTINATYQMRDIDSAAATGTEPTSWAIGLDHNFSKRTKAYAIYTDFDSDGAGNDQSYFSLGMSHTF